MSPTSTIPPICFWLFPLMVDRTFGALLGFVWAFIPFYTRCKQALKRLVLFKDKFVDSSPKVQRLHFS